jgi:hypothetical protein
MVRPRNITPQVHVLRKDGRWQCWWSLDGKVIRRSCDDAKTEAQAREVAARRYREWSFPVVPVATWTVGTLLDKYTDYKTKTGPANERAKSPSFTYAFPPLRAHFAGYTAAMLGPDAWSSYREQRTSQHVANAGSKFRDATAVRELNALRGALNWAKARKWAGLETFDSDRDMRHVGQQRI